jgi:DNA-binding IclR family transcriptional regulator
MSVRGEAVIGGEGQAGVQSIEVGMHVLVTLADHGGEMALGELAAAAGAAPAKVHRYLVSLIRSGFVEQDPRSGRYALSSQSLRVGLVALGRLDVMEVATTALYSLRDRIDETVLMAVWGAHGATIVRWLEASRPVTVNVRAGSIMPLVSSATGQVFGAFGRPALIEPVLERELADSGRRGVATTRAEAESLFQQVRARGLGHVAGQMLAGVHALGAPVFDHQGQLALALTALGPNGGFDDSEEGPIATILRDAARSLSARLGYLGGD